MNRLLNGNINSLSNFTPEEMLLIYMNLVYEDNIDKLNALTYSGGQLPPNLIEDYLMFRSATVMDSVPCRRICLDASLKGGGIK